MIILFTISRHDHINHIISVGAVLQLVIMIILFTWTPSQYEVYVLFIVSCLWGFCDGIWQTQINGIVIKKASYTRSHSE